MYRAGRQWQAVDAACSLLLLLGLRVNGDDDEAERPPAAAGQREAVLVTAAMGAASAGRTRGMKAGGGGWLAGSRSPLFSWDIFVAAVCMCGNGDTVRRGLACGRRCSSKEWWWVDQRRERDLRSGTSDLDQTINWNMPSPVAPSRQP